MKLFVASLAFLGLTAAQRYAPNPSSVGSGGEYNGNPALFQYAEAPREKRKVPSYYNPKVGSIENVNYNYDPKEEDLKPKAFQNQYQISDAESGNNFNAQEEQDDQGNRRGVYRIQLPDCRVQITEYIADHIYGFQAKVRYEGEPCYPEPPVGGYPGETPETRNRNPPRKYYKQAPRPARPHRN